MLRFRDCVSCCTIFFIVLISSCWLQGCASQPNSPSTTETQINAKAWEDDDFRALVPKPCKQWKQVVSSSVSREIQLNDMSYGEAKSYVKELQAAGFVRYVQSEENSELPYLSYVAKDDQNTVVRFYAGLENDEASEMSFRLLITNLGINRPKVPEHIEQAREPLGSTVYQSMLPEPVPAYSSDEIRQADNAYVLHLNYASFQQIKDYANSLYDFGFNRYITVRHNPWHDTFSYEAQNQSGYSVYLSSTFFEQTPYSTTTLILCPPKDGSLQQVWQEEINKSYLPAPPAENYLDVESLEDIDTAEREGFTLKQKGTVLEIALEGMTYDLAKAYMATLIDAGYSHHAILEDDAEGAALNYSAVGQFKQQSSIHSFFVKLEYKPTADSESGSNCVLMFYRVSVIR